MNPQQILDFLLEKQAEYEEMCIQPSLGNIIHDLKQEIEEEYTLPHNAGHDDEYPVSKEVDEEDWSGASDTLTDFNNR